ncbi:hypothetical protein ACIPC1_15135 [Streptomyces sp. NPDC087263]|uniref:hypothetical protein n=1 Tax=Streptomyces sp. NPDC087263 TaxID=3365773 RepID=UPI00381D944C
MPNTHSTRAECCDRALENARRKLVVRSRDRFSSALWYGAVDIDPTKLVVWVLLAGDAARLPTWYFPGAAGTGDDLPEAALLPEIELMRQDVVAAFTEEGWPDAEHLRVGFDAEARVAAEGGFRYFRG